VNARPPFRGATLTALLAKFDGKIAIGLQTYAGSGTLQYTW
jgi:hypothetical protein